jgi:hypothetical protein
VGGWLGWPAAGFRVAARLWGGGAAPPAGDYAARG